VSAAKHGVRQGFEPGNYVPYISPTPLQMIVGRNALEPKKLVLLSGGHFAPYEEEFELSSAAARDWFVGHLGTAAK